MLVKFFPTSSALQGGEGVHCNYYKTFLHSCTIQSARRHHWIPDIYINNTSNSNSFFHENENIGMVVTSVHAADQGISCCIASSRRRTMSAAAERVADPKRESSATMRHERCQTAKPSTRGRVPATSAAFQTAKRLGAMTRVAASARVEPITTTMKSAHGA